MINAIYIKAVNVKRLVTLINRLRISRSFWSTYAHMYTHIYI